MWMPLQKQMIIAGRIGGLFRMDYECICILHCPFSRATLTAVFAVPRVVPTHSRVFSRYLWGGRMNEVKASREPLAAFRTFMGPLGRAGFDSERWKK